MWGNKETSIISFDSCINFVHLIIAYMTYVLVRKNATETDEKRK